MFRIMKRIKDDTNELEIMQMTKLLKLRLRLK